MKKLFIICCIAIINVNAQTLQSYMISYKIGHKKYEQVVPLSQGTQSEAILTMKGRQIVPVDAQVEIISIEKTDKTTQAMKSYKVKYRIGNTTSERILKLHSSSESEAIEKLKQQNNVPDNATVIILSITEV